MPSRILAIMMIGGCIGYLCVATVKQDYVIIAAIAFWAGRLWERDTLVQTLSRRKTDADADAE